MNDLIRKADAIESIASRGESNGTVKRFTGREVNSIIASLPTVDAEPVVRCKDCKFCYHDEEYGWYWCNRMTGSWRIEPDDYCSEARPKEE